MEVIAGGAACKKKSSNNYYDTLLLPNVLPLWWLKFQMQAFMLVFLPLEGFWYWGKGNSTIARWGRRVLRKNSGGLLVRGM